MGNLSHDRCYGELTRKNSPFGKGGPSTLPPLEKGDTGGFKISPNPSLRKRGEHPSMRGE